jgi:hypothetical protein
MAEDTSRGIKAPDLVLWTRVQIFDQNDPKV